jgi:chromosome partitioning protein
VKTFTVWNHKGGVGKTSLTSLLSLYLSETSRKVLMIDLDSQESLTSGFLEENETRKTVYDWLIGKAKIKDCIEEVNSNLSIISGSLLVSKIQNSVNQSVIRRDLKNLDFEYCFIDCPPTWSNSIVAAINASDKILIPSLNSVYDLKSTKFTLNEVQDIDKDLETFVIFNRCKSLSKIEKELQDSLFSKSTILSFPSFTSVNTAIKTKKLKGNLKDEIKKLFESLEGVL